MASVCSEAGFDYCGVPVKGSFGIAMGLLMDNSGNYTILVDIQGLEDWGYGLQGGVLQRDYSVAVGY